MAREWANAGGMSAQVNVKEVVVLNLVPAVPSMDLQRVYVDGVKRFYSGKVVVAGDLMTFQLSAHSAVAIRVSRWNALAAGASHCFENRRV